MASGFREFVEEVRAASDLVEVIGEDVQLKGSGRVLKGLSPFRSEQHPSFCVWPEDQRWYDFAGGSGQGGDVFSYIQQRDGVGFKEAVFALAERKGIRRPDQDEEAYQKELALLVERRDVERLLTRAATYFHGVLPSKVREEYLRDHYGFTDETIDELALGFADGHLFEHFRDDLKVGRELALKTGLFVIVKGGKVEDFFRDRLVFPYWRGGQVAYFIARSTQYTGDEAWEHSKYKKLLTHSERHGYVSTTVRNDTFWGEDAARGAEQILITEGITDAISARQAGIPCISPVTTRFRKQDIPKLLKLIRTAARVVICNDAEESGAGAAGALETASALQNGHTQTPSDPASGRPPFQLHPGSTSDGPRSATCPPLPLALLSEFTGRAGPGSRPSTGLWQIISSFSSKSMTTVLPALTVSGARKSKRPCWPSWTAVFPNWALRASGAQNVAGSCSSVSHARPEVFAPRAKPRDPPSGPNGPSTSCFCRSATISGFSFCQNACASISSTIVPCSEIWHVAP